MYDLALALVFGTSKSRSKMSSSDESGSFDEELDLARLELSELRGVGFFFDTCFFLTTCLANSVPSGPVDLERDR